MCHPMQVNLANHVLLASLEHPNPVAAGGRA